MNKLLLTILIAISINSFGQQWTKYNVDSILTITIPENFQAIDTAGQRVIMCQIDNGLIVISVMKNQDNTAVNVTDENALIDFYRGFQKGLIKSQKGELIKDKILEINGLKLLEFSFKATMGDEDQIRHCLSLFVDNKTYSINFWELESMTNEMTPVREQLFNSIKLPTSFTIKNQMSSLSKSSETYNISYFIGQVIGYALIFTAVGYLVFWITKKNRNKSTHAQP